MFFRKNGRAMGYKNEIRHREEIELAVEHLKSALESFGKVLQTMYGTPPFEHMWLAVSENNLINAKNIAKAASLSVQMLSEQVIAKNNNRQSIYESGEERAKDEANRKAKIKAANKAGITLPPRKRGRPPKSSTNG